MRPEESVEHYLVTQAEKLGFLCYKFTSPANSGVPDRVLIGHGKTFFVETKAPGKKPRKLQEHMIAEMRSYGGLVFVAASREEVDLIFAEMLGGKAAIQKKPKK